VNSEFQYVHDTDGLEPVRGVGDLLERQLVEPVRRPLLEVDDLQAVCERRRRVPVREAARHLVDGGEAEPDRQLEPEIGPAAREVSATGCDDSGHEEGIVVSRAA